MAKGGRRAGAGRKAGTRNKATVEREQFVCAVVAQATASGQSPLDVMLSIMRSEEAPMGMRFKAAVEAAPYIHAKLSSVDMKADVKVSTEEQILEELTGRTRGIPSVNGAKTDH